MKKAASGRLFCAVSIDVPGSFWPFAGKSDIRAAE
jgi:hypothetical protein